VIEARLFVWALIFATCCFAESLVAQNPTTAVKRGYKVEYTNVLPNGAIGQAPVRVRLTRTPTVPSKNDQSFNVSITEGQNWNGDSFRSSFSAELALPAGKTSAEVELLVDLENNYYHSLIVEQGARHTHSRGNDIFNDQVPIARDYQNNDPAWLLISSKAPKNPTVGRTHYLGKPLNNSFNSNIGVTTVGQATFTQTFRGDKEIPGLKQIFQEPLTNVLNRPNWHAIQPAELPETWVGLSSINYILISNDEFQSLTQVPAYRKIIERWVAAGGYLVVFNAEYSLAHAGSVFPALLGADRAKPTRLWGRVSTKRSDRFVREPQISGLEVASDLVAKNRTAISPYLNGTVAVTVTPEKLPEWWFGNQHLPAPTPISSVATRVGEGVGQPPIALFGVFTGLFLFLIGPVILVIVTLNNNKRFLFFLVPVFSFLTCTGILGYAIVADFNKQLARTNTITVLDAKSGFAYSEAYSAYYCGSQPSYYAYDPDTLVQTTVESDTGFRIRKLPEENRLSSPRIQPRKSHEVFTTKPYPTQQRFLVAKSAEKQGAPEITNLLGGRIEKAFFEYEGKAFLVQDLEPKQTTLGIELPLEDCRRALRQVVADQQVRGGSALFRSGDSRASRVITSKTGTSWDQENNARNFVAILDVNPAIQPLIEPFEYKLQLHVVHGKY